jgi:hypothetical protein
VTFPSGWRHGRELTGLADVIANGSVFVEFFWGLISGCQWKTRPPGSKRENEFGENGGRPE